MAESGDAPSRTNANRYEHVCLAICIANAEDLAKDAPRWADIRSAIGPGLHRAVENDMLVIVFPIERSNMDPLNLRTIAHRAIGTLLRFPTSRLPWVGVGYSNNETDERDTEARAREKALVALGLGKAVWREPRVVLHDDVWIFDALCRDRRTLETVAALLDPLIAYDTEHGTDLVATVEAFSDADLSQADAARLLGVHRHTVSTRLLLAEQVLGRPLQVGPDRLLVELAPKARRLLYLT